MTFLLKPKNMQLHRALEGRMNRRNAVAGGAFLAGAASMIAAAQSDNTLNQTPTATEAPADAAPTEVPPTATTAAESAAPTEAPQAAPTEAPAATEAPAEAPAQPTAESLEDFPTEGARLGEGLLPDHRLIMYYGFPEVEQMGILGEMDPDALLARLTEQKAEYEAALNDRPWKMGLELIASVAQKEPGSDGKYIADTDGKWLDMYTEFTKANDMFLLLDVQCGLKTPLEDYAGLEKWLANDHVHLAIDPEFHILPGEIPGDELGSIDAQDIRTAQEWLLGVSNKYKTSRKMLLIHQFNVYSIQNKGQVTPMDGIDLVLNMDGFGPPYMKMDTWAVVIQQQLIEYNGIKLFYKQDEPLMTAAEVMAIEPTPDVINYQ